MTDLDNSIGDEKTMMPDGGREPELKAGERLGQYEIIKLLGRGGMGQVYLARHSMMRTTHAVKLLPAEHANRPGFVERFRSEVQVMANLKHPGIVNVTHADVDKGRYYLVMELITGEDGVSLDLEQVLAAAPDGRLDPETVAQIAIQIAEAVAYAHSHGVIHRDLKPSNVLLSQNIAEVGEQSSEDSDSLLKPKASGLKSLSIKITDFGLAKMVGKEWVQSVIQASLLSIGDQKTVAGGRDPGSTGSSTQSILGTYEYMSPEQREGREADARSDIYALGVMLYRMITGKRIMGFPKPPSRIVEGLDAKWDDLIIQCLEGDKEDRPQSMDEVRKKLLECGGNQRATPLSDEDLAAKARRERESTTTGNVVPEEYRDRYAENGGNNGDGLAWALEKYLRGKELVPALEELGKLNGVDVKAQWGDNNPGMQRMNLGNVLRGMIRRGEKVEVPEVCTWNPEDGVKLSYTKKRLHFIRSLIEDLDADDVFKIVSESGTFRMSRAQFNDVFNNILLTVSWEQNGEYHSSQPPQKAMRFLVDGGTPSSASKDSVCAVPPKKKSDLENPFFLSPEARSREAVAIVTATEHSEEAKKKSGKGWIVVVVVLVVIGFGIYLSRGGSPNRLAGYATERVDPPQALRLPRSIESQDPEDSNLITVDVSSALSSGLTGNELITRIQNASLKNDFSISSIETSALNDATNSIILVKGGGKRYEVVSFIAQLRDSGFSIDSLNIENTSPYSQTKNTYHQLEARCAHNNINNSIPQILTSIINGLSVENVLLHSLSSDSEKIRFTIIFPPPSFGKNPAGKLRSVWEQDEQLTRIASSIRIVRGELKQVNGHKLYLVQFELIPVRDPLTITTPEIVINEEEPVQPATSLNVELSAIYWSQTDPIATINGENCHVGDSVQGHRIVEIRKTEVVFENPSGKKTVKYFYDYLK